VATRPEDTRGDAYTDRLSERGGIWWKRLLDVQAPYRWNLRRLQLGFTLDIGCGIGRNLLHLSGNGVGVDHNPRSVDAARARGCTAYTAEAFRRSAHARPASFDALLLAHVVEHMRSPEAGALVGEYLEFLRPGGKVVLIAPQEAGFRSDPSHVEFMDFEKLHQILTGQQLSLLHSYSFPFPRAAGLVFAHNEFVVVGRKPHRGGAAHSPTRSASTARAAR
jgi:SAM-dependent methyltransferase